MRNVLQFISGVERPAWVLESRAALKTRQKCSRTPKSEVTEQLETQYAKGPFWNRYRPDRLGASVMGHGTETLCCLAAINYQ